MGENPDFLEIRSSDIGDAGDNVTVQSFVLAVNSPGPSEGGFIGGITTGREF